MTATGLEPHGSDVRRPPLADRMRPRTLDDFVGQEHIVGPGRLLRRAIQADRLSSVIFFGPPGTGKTTLARIVANTTEAHFIALNAVLAGVKDIRAAVAEAEHRREGLFGQRTLLFVDEVHRFNKAQQDALLPWVENGTITLIGATTENPFFEVNKALVSRSRIFQLEPLEDRHLYEVARAALRDPVVGYGRLEVTIDDDALDHLVDVANGDARALLNALELAVETTAPPVHIDLTVAEESIQRRAVLYDKEGDVHYDTVSAFIKSVRGSDPDAALYWLARMVYAGEDPRFILRRLLILAGEDVGLADPAAIGVVTACARAFEWVGLPEGQFHLAEATLYLANAPKSNSALAYFDALAAVQQERSGDVPDPIKDGNRDGAALGHGAGYRYPHAFRDHWVAQQYLPDGLRGRVFYRPSDQGWEGGLRTLIQGRREAQLAAMLEVERGGSRSSLTWTGPLAPGAAARGRWIDRALGRAGLRLAAVRDALFERAAPARGDRVLDLDAGAGLLTWPALRAVPEGGVWALVSDPEDAAALRDVARTLAEQSGAGPAGSAKGGAGQDAGGRGASAVDGLAILSGSADELPTLLALRGDGEVRFELIVGRDVLGALPSEAARRALLVTVTSLLAPGGRLVLAETVPAESARPSAWLVEEAAKAHVPEVAGEEQALQPHPGRRAAREALVERLAAAESDWLATDPRFGWRPETLRDLLTELGLDAEEPQRLRHDGQLAPSDALVARWLDDGPLATALAERLTEDEREGLRVRLAALVGGPAQPWRVTTALLVAQAATAGDAGDEPAPDGPVMGGAEDPEARAPHGAGELMRGEA